MRRYPLVRYERQEKDVLHFLDEAADRGRGASGKSGNGDAENQMNEDQQR